MRGIKKTTLSISVLCALAINLSATDLGRIEVESSTIDLKTDVKTEVSNVDVISEETLDIVDPKNLVDVLKTVPGMTSVARAGEMMQIRFRGVGQQQFMGENPGVAIIVDGVPVMANAGGIRLNMTDIKSIKVIKGSASYLYGDGALSGALIITTKKPKGKHETTITAELGSYNYQEYTLGTTQGTEDFAINLNASKRSTDGYWTNSKLWTQSINGKFSYYIDDTSDITLGIDVTEKFDEGGTRSVVDGVTAAATNPKGEPNTGYSIDSGIDLNKYFLTYSKDFGNQNINVTAYKYQDLYDYTSNPQDLDNNTSTPNVYVQHSNQDLEQQGLKAEFTMNGDLFATLIGVELGFRDYETATDILADYTAYNSRTRVNENYYKGEKTQNNSKESVQAVYGEFKYNITSQFTTTINARYNVQKKEIITNKLDYNGTIWSNITEEKSHTFKNTAYRAGATYNFNRAIDVFASVSTGFLNPDADDIVANPDIKTQTSINYELGARGNLEAISNNFNYELSIYQLDNKDILGPEDGTYAFSSPMDNMGDTRSRGLELSLNSNPVKSLSFTLAYTYLDAKYTKHNPHVVTLKDKSTVTYDIVGNTVPRVSKHTIDLFLNYNVTNEIKFIAEGYAKSSYYADEANIVKFNGYEIANLQARYNTKLFSNHLELYVKVDNVFDNQYYRAAFLHSDKRGILGIDPEDTSITVDPGRVYYAGIKYTF